MRNRTVTGIVVGALIAVIGASTAAVAAQPPKGYPSNQVMANVGNPIHGTIPIRRGFYDGDLDTGFGFDKAWNKHNLRSLHAQQVLMGSNNSTKQGNGNYDLKTYTGYYNCDTNPCKLVKQQLVHGIYAPNNATYIQGWPVGGKVGLLTAYCTNDSGALDCPNWVTYGIDHPGQDNPYAASASRAGAAATTSGATPGPGQPNQSSPLGQDTSANRASDSTTISRVSYSELPATTTAP